MYIEVPLGEVVDKVSILLLKEERMGDATQVARVREELGSLRASWRDAGLVPMEGLQAWEGLRRVNGQLWEVEDALREHERRQDFGPAFVALARSVYHLNDERARLKADINAALGSRLAEQKSYAPYGGEDAGAS